MKTNFEQFQLSGYGLTEMNVREMNLANGGGLIDETWGSLWGAVLNLVDMVAPGAPLLKQLLIAIIGRPPGH